MPNSFVRRAHLWATSAAMLAAALATHAETAAAQRGASLVVSVSDFDTGSPIADAEVSLADFRRLTEGASRTAANQT